MISIKGAENLEKEFQDNIPEGGDYSAGNAQKVLEAWDHLWKLMERENNFSDSQGSDILDWQIGNWANDTVEIVHNAYLYEEEIRINEQILKMKWRGDDNLFHENAKRDIADAYASMGDIQKCYELYEEYLREDPLALDGLHYIHRWRSPKRSIPMIPAPADQARSIRNAVEENSFWEIN